MNKKKLKGWMDGGPQLLIEVYCPFFREVKKLRTLNKFKIKTDEPLEGYQINAYLLSKPFLIKFTLMSLVICVACLAPTGVFFERLIIAMFTSCFTIGFMLITMGIDLSKIRENNRQTHKDNTESS